MTKFANYAASVGFRVELTKNQIACMELIAYEGRNMAIIPFNAISSWQSLLEKGLVQIENNEYVFTEEGALLMKLLEKAEVLGHLVKLKPLSKRSATGLLDKLQGE